MFQEFSGTSVRIGNLVNLSATSIHGATVAWNNGISNGTAGCDSTVTTDLTVGAAIAGSQTLVECAGFSTTLGTST